MLHCVSACESSNVLVLNNEIWRFGYCSSEKYKFQLEVFVLELQYALCIQFFVYCGSMEIQWTPPIHVSLFTASHIRGLGS